MNLSIYSLENLENISSEESSIRRIKLIEHT